MKLFLIAGCVLGLAGASFAADKECKDCKKVADKFKAPMELDDVRADAPATMSENEFPWPALTPEELKFEELLSRREQQPKLDDFTKRLTTDGGCWVEKVVHKSPTFGEITRSEWSYDWTLLKEPQNLSTKGRDMFWVIMNKRFDYFYARFQRAKRDHELQQRSDLLGDLIASEGSQGESSDWPQEAPYRKSFAFLRSRLPKDYPTK